MYWYWLDEVEIDGSRNEYGPVSGRVAGVGSGEEGIRQLFLPLVGQGETVESALPTEEPPAPEVEPPAESNTIPPILLPLINR